MSMDRSLKSKASLSRHRNVLNRYERLTRLKEEERWDDSKSVFGIPKVVHRKSTVGKKVKAEKAAAEGEAAAAAPGAAGAAAAAPAADAKGAAKGTAKGGEKAAGKGEKKK